MRYWFEPAIFVSVPCYQVLRSRRMIVNFNVNYGRYKLTVSRVTNSSVELLSWKLHVLVIERTLKQYFKSFTQPSWYLPEQTILAKCRPARWNGTWYMQKTYPYCFLGYLLLLVLTCRQKGPFGAGSPYLQAVAFSYWAL